ncbi:NADPH-dependent FMN reductase [Actinacidiphila guanduensis]|jgi:NAD(P)H-dependent FMN reductase|uniref:NAD(P)H-dependent FMN reductase n=1 Tax=Actinacidiphila guanduensis TaxID=310781 RepID=A0A1H0MTH9_9ACTN|nr:NAD(P)H-dependent oxidoreductase [Actinacidiphila guanduensis]SDO83674.1 NAD(P)H-dependent FMN reductase [Actinacidiphila guanduensis]
MSQNPVRVAVIVGSARAGRFGPTVARWFVGQARQFANLDVDVIDLAEDDLHLALAAGDDGRVDPVSRRLDDADAFVVVTPEYNHSFPAPLKALIDWHRPQWQAKPVGFVCYGGISQGLRAVEQLRLVFAELHAVSIRDTVSFQSTAGVFDADGEPTDDGCTVASKTLLDQLVWWAVALRDARAARPYAA